MREIKIEVDGILSWVILASIIVISAVVGAYMQKSFSEKQCSDGQKIERRISVLPGERIS